MARHEERVSMVPEKTLGIFRDLAADFRDKTLLPLLLVGKTGERLWSLGGCTLCRRLLREPCAETLCREHRRKAVEESLRWGEAYISVCPLGLVTFAVPVSLGGLISGFAILPQMQKEIAEDISRNLQGLGFPAAPSSLKGLRYRVLPSEELRKDAELLIDLTGKYGLSDLESIRESREKSVQQFTIADVISKARTEQRDLAASLIASQNEIIDRVVLGDLPGSREIINRFLGVIFLESGMNFAVLKVRLLELIVIISRAAIMKGINADGLLGPRYCYLTDINSTTEFDDLCWKVTKVLENFCKTVSADINRKTWAHVTKMKDYVKRHFSGRVTAAEVAAAAGLSVGRALHLFTREVGMPLSSYINKQRIEYAKHELENSSKSAAEIAVECGFYDQSHFTKMFLAMEKISPLRYRKRRASLDVTPP
jgi:two-component system response regulator YesN